MPKKSFVKKKMWRQSNKLQAQDGLVPLPSGQWGRASQVKDTIAREFAAGHRVGLYAR